MPLSVRQRHAFQPPASGAGREAGLPLLPRGLRPAPVDEVHPAERPGDAVPTAEVRKRLPLLSHRPRPGRHGEARLGRPSEPNDDEPLQLPEEDDQAPCVGTHRQRELFREDAQGREGRHVRPDVRPHQGRLSRHDHPTLQETQSQRARPREGTGGQSR